MRLFSLMVALFGVMFGAAYIWGTGSGPARSGLTSEPQPEVARAQQAPTDTVAARPAAAVDRATVRHAPAVARLTTIAPGKTGPVVMPAPQQAAVTQDEPETPATQTSAVDVRNITAASVNVRGGPSTSFEVVDRLSRGEQVEVVEISDNGWARVRIQGDGVEGWMSAKFLSK